MSAGVLEAVGETFHAAHFITSQRARDNREVCRMARSIRRDLLRLSDILRKSHRPEGESALLQTTPSRNHSRRADYFLRSLRTFGSSIVLETATFSHRRCPLCDGICNPFANARN